MDRLDIDVICLRVDPMPRENVLRHDVRPAQDVADSMLRREPEQRRENRVVSDYFDVYD